MNDLTDVATYSAAKPKGYRNGNLEKSIFEFVHRILVEGETYILTETLNNQPRSRWLANSREQADELLTKRREYLEQLYDKTLRMVVQPG